jgi:carbon monoxide dehydrogenase subunit G
MQLSHTFTVSLPVEEAWETLLDLERIAPCLPGAAMTGVEGSDYHGGVKIKVGPISAQYRGVATFVETDEVAHRAVISAKGKDVGGQGNAHATITATVTPYGEGSEVQVDTELDLSGRVAQFGRGVIGDVTGKLLTQFAKNLEAEIGAGSAGSADSATGAPGGGPRPRRHVSLDDVEPLDVMGTMGGSIARYALPALGAVVAVGLGIVLARRPGSGAVASVLPVAPINIYLTFPAGTVGPPMLTRVDA